MMEPIELKERQAAVLPDKTWAVGGCRGREKRKVVSYSLTNEIGEENCLRWQKKFDHICETEQRWENFYADDAEYLLVRFGTCGRIAKSVVLNARSQGVKLGLIGPITLWPFPEKAFKNIVQKVTGIVTLELNAGQMIEDVKLAVDCRVPVHLYSRQGEDAAGRKRNLGTPVKSI